MSGPVKRTDDTYPEKRKMATAKATYTVESWDEDPAVTLDDGTKVTRASVVGSYEGDVEGRGRSESVMWYRADGTATFVAIERIEGSIGGRSGSFVLRSVGEYDGENARAEQEVVAGSGTGGLEDLTGRARFKAPPGHQGALELEYDLDGG